ncbi:MAG: four helix bundle protein [Verrucomicrobia bacterium]|nr:four helix bundle protein [Verrucomicrobiota bacterium]
MANIRSYRELKVWQRAMDTAMEVYAHTKHFPASELYSLTDQIRRSSRSVAANIAEAWRKRRYPAAFVCKLNDAEGEASETQTHIEFALRCGYISETPAKELDAHYEEILSMLVTMINSPEKWTPTPSPRPRVSPSPRLS